MTELLTRPDVVRAMNDVTATLACLTVVLGNLSPEDARLLRRQVDSIAAERFGCRTTGDDETDRARGALVTLRQIRRRLDAAGRDRLADWIAEQREQMPQLAAASQQPGTAMTYHGSIELLDVLALLVEPESGE